MNLDQKLKKLEVVIVTHVYATGPSFNLEEYLTPKVKELTFIGHPFSFAKDIRSFFRFYRNGKLIKAKFAPAIVLPGLSWYLKDIFYTFFWLNPLGKKYDLFVGVDGVNALSGLVLKKLGRVKKVIFYTIDYIPQRFKNRILNKIYHAIDSFCVRNADFVWNLSPIMVSEREKKGIEKKYRRKQLTVPVGTETNIIFQPFSKIKRYQIVHMGHLTQKQGVQLAIASLPEILKVIPEATFLIIGDGDYRKNLEILAKRLGVENKIKFTGFIKEHSEVEELLSECALAVAPYTADQDNFVRYTDPGKVKAYLAAGLPIVITNIPQVSWELEKERCGLVVRYDKKEFVRAVIKLLTDEKLLKEYRENAQELAQKYRWEVIFAKALKKLFYEK